GNWIMDTRISMGLGTAAVALLLLPLGYQLYTSTAITPVDFERREPVPSAADGGEQLAKAEAPASDDAVMAEAAESSPPVPMEAEAGRSRIATGAGPGDAATAPSPVMQSATPLGTVAPDAATVRASAPSDDQFTLFDESPVKVVADEPVSTFSIDVDTASYAYVRRMLTDGYMPQPDAVRIEEMINYFDYGYSTPETAETPFQATMQIYPAPWNPKTQLLQIGIKGYVPPVTEDKASNLVFLLDTSGSMDEPDKLPLLKRAFALLVDQLSANDTVSIVAYAGSADVVLEPTRATDKATILGALDNLWAGGSTAGADGIELAYQLAAQNKVAGG